MVGQTLHDSLYFRAMAVRFVTPAIGWVALSTNSFWADRELVCVHPFYLFAHLGTFLVIRRLILLALLSFFTRLICCDLQAIFLIIWPKGHLFTNCNLHRQMVFYHLLSRMIVVILVINLNVFKGLVRVDLLPRNIILDKPHLSLWCGIIWFGFSQGM